MASSLVPVVSAAPPIELSSPSYGRTSDSRPPDSTVDPLPPVPPLHVHLAVGAPPPGPPTGSFTIFLPTTILLETWPSQQACF